MIPIAFYKGQGHADVYAMTPREFLAMTEDHLCDAHEINTEFTSWSASLNFANNYADGKKRAVPYISVIDTEGLPNKNKIWYIPTLHKMTGQLQFGFEVYSCEYLVHGVVEGPAHQAVKFAALNCLGLKMYAPPMIENYWAKAGILTAEVLPINWLDVSRLERIASQFGTGPLGTAVLITLVCLPRRSSDLWKNSAVPNELVELLLQCSLFDFTCVRWGLSDKIMSDIAMVGDYEDVQQAIRLMRAIHLHQLPFLAKTKAKQTLKKANATSAHSTSPKHAATQADTGSANLESSPCKKNKTAVKALWDIVSKRGEAQKRIRASVDGIGRRVALINLHKADHEMRKAFCFASK